MHYLKKSPIWDESDHTIFSRKYMEDEMFSVVLKNGEAYNNLRYGTNIFFRDIEFSTPFVDDEYCVFFNTYGDGQFVFGYDKSDLMAQEEPTYDAVVSMPMILNKTNAKTLKKLFSLWMKEKILHLQVMPELLE